MWKLNCECSILQTKLFAIYQAIKLINHLMQINEKINFDQIYVYSDSQQALKQLQSNEIKGIIAQIHDLCNKLQQEGIQIIFQ